MDRKNKNDILEALRKSLDMWKWLANCRIADSHQFVKLGYFDAMGINDLPANLCYLCELCEEGTILHCEDCPVIWGVGEQAYAEGIFCEFNSSPYKRWYKAATLEERQSCANEVVDRIQLAIDRLK